MRLIDIIGDKRTIILVTKIEKGNILCKCSCTDNIQVFLEFKWILVIYMTWQCLYKVVDVLDISSTPIDSNNTTSIRYRLMKSAHS